MQTKATVCFWSIFNVIIPHESVGWTSLVPVECSFTHVLQVYYFTVISDPLWLNNNHWKRTKSCLCNYYTFIFVFAARLAEENYFLEAFVKMLCLSHVLPIINIALTLFNLSTFHYLQKTNVSEAAALPLNKNVLNVL